jgi:hypothetical protein
MATTAGTPVKPHGLGLLHAAATAAAVVVFLFVLFWASVAFGMLPHLRVLLGPMGAGSPIAFLIGVIYALVGGALIGLLVAVFYNGFRFLGAVQSVERR